MSSDSEYQALLSRKEEKQREYRDCQKKIEEYDYLLKRLRPARDAVSQQKRTFRKIKNEDEKIIEKRYKWSGERYDQFRINGACIKTEDRYYCDNILDHVLDSLNNEITRIENLKMSKYALLGQLGSAINSLSNSIRNYFN